MEILIEKSLRRLTLTKEDGSLLVFPVALGKNPTGHKKREGDNRTPEGEYYVCTRNERSKYHLALGLSYPNPTDAATALEIGFISPSERASVEIAHISRLRPPWDTPLGGFIMIHGGGIDGDWTAGCIALRNEDIEILFALCPLGTPVSILP